MSFRGLSLRQQREARERGMLDAQLRLRTHNKVNSQPQSLNMLDLLTPYQEYFISDPALFCSKTKSTNDDKRLLEMVRYLFCKYRVKPWFTKVWLRKIHGTQWSPFNPFRPHTSIDPILWFICVAQGGSLYKTYAKDYLTKMETHSLINCPHELSFEETMVFATAKTFAKNGGEALRLAHSKISTLHFDAFLKTVIYFFAKNPPDSLDEINDLVDFIVDRRRRTPTWSLAGRTLDSLRQKCKDWHYELRRIKVIGDYRWEGAPLPDSTLQTGSDQQPMHWQFRQILSSKLLAEEGTQMRHCVYGYKERCVEGHTSIWSLTRTENFAPVRKVTIELSNNGNIVQARGLANRPMRADERHVVSLWARENGLKLCC